MQLDVFCQNQLLARSQDDDAYSKKHPISLNAMLKPFENIPLDEIALIQVDKIICGPSLVGYLVLI